MPTVVISDNVGADYAGNECASGQDWHSTWNFGAASTIHLGHFAWGHTVGFIRFTGLAGIAGPVTVSAATMSIQFNNVTGKSINFRKCLRAWGEGNNAGVAADAGESSWDCYASASAWTTAGAGSDGNDRSATDSGTLTTSAVEEYRTLTSANFITDVADFINSGTNNGHVMFCTDAAAEEYTQMRTDDYAAGSRPFLTITYAAATGFARRLVEGNLAEFGGLVYGGLA